MPPTPRPADARAQAAAAASREVDLNALRPDSCISGELHRTAADPGLSGDGWQATEERIKLHTKL